MHITPVAQDVRIRRPRRPDPGHAAGDAESDPQGRRWEQRVEVMRDAIVYNRNNPSILFYEGGNEGISDAHMAS
jgi:beta-galactosidase